MSFAKAMRQAIHSKRFEPVKRNKDGWRYVGHRFPIKGGISLLDVMVRNMVGDRNRLLEQLLKGHTK